MSTRPLYDVSIWEQIALAVRWKMGQLVDILSNEISQDASLAEFWSDGPVPWQLRQIMEQRADAWVQSAYDLCCDTYESNGKAPSVDFDRSVWAYCVEPFIMSGKESDIHSDASSGFLELLLCAVGSTPRKRNLLTVSQKQCCLAVRLKVYRTWSERLHHLTPEIKEGIVALARFNAMERRAARVVAGLPPESPPSSPPPSLLGPLVESQITAFNSDHKITAATSEGAVDRCATDGGGQTVPASLSSAQRVPEAEAQEPTPADRNVGTMATWETIEIWFLSDKRVQIRNGSTTETLNYAEFGFVDGRTRNPNQAWETFCALAQQDGIIRDGTATNTMWPKVEKRVQEIRRILREHFGISSDPIPFVSGVGYKSSFKIGCRPSFDT